MKREKIERLLPAVIHRALHPETPLAAILDLMEALHEPSEAALATLAECFDPYRAPPGFVPFLARWVDLDHLFEEVGWAGELPSTIDLGRLRELVAAAAALSRWRGTRGGLQLFLETATGERGFEIDERVPEGEGPPRPFHLRVLAPAVSRSQRALIAGIIEREKPVYVTYELDFEPLPGKKKKS
jgi:phage tail-like protein